MHVIQSQLTNYSYHSFVQKQLRLVRWWVLVQDGEGQEKAMPFNREQQEIFVKFMDDHPHNFPKEKREIFDSVNLVPPLLDLSDQAADPEKPCILLIRNEPPDPPAELCRRMDIVLQHTKLPIRLPFDIAGEIILEKV